MQDKDLQKKCRALQHAGAALSQLLLKLENDGHLVSIGGSRPVVVLLPEMIAYVTAHYSETGTEEERLLRDLLQILPPEEERTLQGILQGIRKSVITFRENPDEAPGVYEALCSFDDMAQAYEGAFYVRMQVENPGPLAAYYLQLLDGTEQLAGQITGREMPEQGRLSGILEEKQK